MNLERRHWIWDHAPHAIFLLAFCVSALGVEVTEKQVQFYMSKPGFQGMISAIVRVNQAMRTAAENPMDKWRREDVRKAMAAMPGAIKGLAGEFFSGSLHDGDFPAIQSMMGGFVDVSAADAYKKFLRNPDPSLIPKVGANFPGNLNAPVPPSPAEQRSGDAHVHGAGQSDHHGHDHGQSALAQSGEVVDLARDLASIVEGSATKGGQESARGLHFNEQAESDSLLQKAISGLGGAEEIAAQATSSNTSAASKSESASAEGTPTNFVHGVAMDLSSLEEEEECDPEDDDCELGDEKIFELSEDEKDKKKTEKKTVTKKKKESSSKKKKISLDPFKYELKKKAKKWRASSVLWTKFLLSTPARGESQSMAICLRCLESRGRTNHGLLECRNAGLCSTEDLRFLARSGALGSAGPGGLGGGPGGASPQNLGLISLHQILAASAAMTTAIVAATSRADADKHQALMQFFKSTIPSAIQADAQKFLASNQASLNAAINATTLFNFKVQQEGRREREALLLDAAFRNQQFKRQQNLLDNLQKDYFAHQDFLLKMTLIGNQAELTKTATLAKAYVQNMSNPPTTLPVAAVATSNGELPTRQPFFSSVGVGSNRFPSNFRRGFMSLYTGQRQSIAPSNPSLSRPLGMRSVTHGYRSPSALRPVHWGFRSPLRQK